MNQAPQLVFPSRPPFGSRRGIAMGIAVSALLHVLLIFGYRISIPPAALPPPPAEAMTVWLRPAPPPVPLPPAKPKELPPPKAVAKVEPPRKKPKEEEKLAAKPNPPAPAAPPAQAAAPAPPQPITVPAPAGQQADLLHPESQPKKFDMEAALKTARKVANERDPARADLPVGQLDTHPLYPEQNDTKLSRDIQSAKRPNCKDISGNLLTPLTWLFDKKDSGCKW